MKLLKLWRTFREGFTNFWRNGWLSVATIIVMTLSLFIVSLTLAVGFVSKGALSGISEKVNISVYFNPDVEEKRILEIKDDLVKYREIKSIEYVSKDQALDELKALNNEKVLQAIEEVGENPLLSSLVIKANLPEQYEIIAKAVENSNFRDELNQVNYASNKAVIERLNKVVRLLERVGLILGSLFILLAVLITFNTIRITIYAHKQEFEIMRLVGASNLYVEMPFIFEGIFYGISAAILSFISILLAYWYIISVAQKIASDDAIAFMRITDGWFSLFGVLLLSGIVLGVISSSIAIRRYLKK